MKLIRVIKQTTCFATTTAIFECPICGKEFVTTLKNSKRIKSCGCLKKTETYLGPGLCNRGHDYNGTGRSLRYKKSKECVMCAKIRNKDRNYTRLKHERKNLKACKKAQAEAALKCPYYQDCLNEIMRKNSKQKYLPCLTCEKKKLIVGQWQKEPGVDVLLSKKSDYTEYRVTEKY